MDDPRVASARLHADVERLRAQAELSWPREFKALTQAGLRDGMTVLEVGSGPGFITEALLRDLPNSHVTALELDPAMHDRARERLPQNDRVHIVQSSILFTDLPNDVFDFAIARYVFQHLPAPDLAAAEIKRLLNRGGRLAILDIDDDLPGLVRPALPAFATLGQRVRDHQARLGGNRHVGRTLWRVLVEGGFDNVDLSGVIVHSDELGLEAFRPQFEPRRYRPFVGPGGLSADEWSA